MQSTRFLRRVFALSLLWGGIVAVPAIATPKIASPNLPTSSKIAAQPSSQPTGQLTEENIRQVLTAIDKAINQKDLDTVLKFVAPFVYTEVTVESSLGTLTTPLEGKDELRDLLKIIYARVKESSVVNQQIKIDVRANGELAVANVTTVEALTTAEGNRYYASSTDTFRFAWLNNQPTIVSITIRGWLAERAPQK
jgi:ketosteroid isomerase-like protein